ncbi:MAG TPA: secondary thiamine-phosphate synthase enzyme YjbQ [Aliidongia sp.]|uniref:secondary thiamine-phosphate synthase enzyme YjbQ n=1 Tax=Aliidongia sp. TaxID=1914230 RepID=UPI002DDD188E|nr:secondary thiamine-phosphate synthase enzyme YjbQ [Aliidongia sp.]HEV2676557.1 secondary thiamine-phosphate synthase enzyme YjbQ [Aliidongia sp.]
MRQARTRLSIETGGGDLTDVTGRVVRWLGETGLSDGLLTIFCRHTSASLLVQENADPDVQRDLIAFFRRLVPEGDPLYRHTDEGPDDMPAHVRAALTQTQLSIPFEQGRMVLGTWQGIYVFEHRRRPHRRELALHALGD